MSIEILNFGSHNRGVSSRVSPVLVFCKAIGEIEAVVLIWLKDPALIYAMLAPKSSPMRAILPVSTSDWAESHAKTPLTSKGMFSRSWTVRVQVDKSHERPPGSSLCPCPRKSIRKHSVSFLKELDCEGTE